MKADESGGIPEISYEILSYLADRPGAQDTLRGIAEWWLLRRCIERQLAKVREALDQLVERGFLVEKAEGRGEARYQINRGRLPEIRRILRERD